MSLLKILVGLFALGGVLCFINFLEQDFQKKHKGKGIEEILEEKVSKLGKAAVWIFAVLYLIFIHVALGGILCGIGYALGGK